jgi:Helix-turn-helix domain
VRTHPDRNRLGMYRGGSAVPGVASSACLARRARQAERTPRHPLQPRIGLGHRQPTQVVADADRSARAVHNRCREGQQTLPRREQLTHSTSEPNHRPLNGHVARSYGVVRSWIYELLARYREEGEAAFEPRSRRPKTCCAPACGCPWQLRRRCVRVQPDPAQPTVRAEYRRQLEVPSPRSMS